MKKKTGIIIGSIAAAGVLGFGIFQTSASTVEPTLTTDEISQVVTDQYPGTITELELEKEFNRAVYEVEVLSGEKEYDLKLDGHSGEVLNIKEKEIKKSPKAVENNDKDGNKDDDKVAITEKKKGNEAKGKTESNQKENKAKDKTENKAKKAVISVKEVEKIALNEFAGKISEIELDEDDGRLIYEVEIKGNGKEADIDIDAYTGEIILLEIDEDDDLDD